jgi:hypothetical protein
LFLAGERLVDIVVGFPVEQADYIVTIGEAFVVMEFVLEDAFVEVAAYSRCRACLTGIP